MSGSNGVRTLKYVTLLSFQIIDMISPLIFLVVWLVLTHILGASLAFMFCLLITTFVLYLSLDWYFWCTVKKVYNNTKKYNRNIMLLTEIKHEGTERHCHTIWLDTADFFCTIQPIRDIKIETTNSPIHQKFTKMLHKGQGAFEIPFSMVYFFLYVTLENILSHAF